MPNKWKGKSLANPAYKYCIIPKERLDPAIEKLYESLKQNLGVDVEAAFSDDVETCANCGHQYTGKRLCPECGA